MKRLGAVVVMGVAGVGKSAVGRALAEQLGWRFEDADDFHSPANRAKMAAGKPLDDDDRWPWLERLRQLLCDSMDSGQGLVLACSALKETYRQRLGQGDPRLAFVYLRGSREVITERLRARQGHYMPASLLDSQFATLEPPRGALSVDVDAELSEVVAEAEAELERLDQERSATDESAPNPRRTP